MSQPLDTEKVNDILRKIDRERKLAEGASHLRKKTNNPSVIQKCNTQVREAQKNIEYLESILRKLQISSANERSASNSPTKNTGPLDSEKDKQNHPYNTARQRPLFTALDLLKYDCPSLGHKIQYMMQLLEFKIQVETQYREANEKMYNLYQVDGDRSSIALAQRGRSESDRKLQLMKRALKEYQSMYIDLDDISRENAMINTLRKNPLSGILTIQINSIRGVDHIQSPMFSRNPECFLSIKIDDSEKAKTRGSRNDKWSDFFEIKVERANELSITIYDKVNDQNVPVGLFWLSLSDIAEEIRRQKVRKERVTSEQWISTGTVDDDIQSGAKSSNATLLDSVPDLSNQDPKYNPNVQSAYSDSSTTSIPIRSNGWFSLEPSGEIYLTLGFVKTNESKTRTDHHNFASGLGRHGAIRQRKEETIDAQGHRFVQKNFYNIMSCAVCNEFLRYNGYQCEDCLFLCHQKCIKNIIAKCISKSSSDINSVDTKLNHKIPHRFVPVTNRGAKWCCHCGYILPFGKKNVRKCDECGIMCHANCVHYVPDLCGISPKTIELILEALRAGQQKSKKKAAATKSSSSVPLAIQKTGASEKTLLHLGKTNTDLLLPSNDQNISAEVGRLAADIYPAKAVNNKSIEEQREQSLSPQRVVSRQESLSPQRVGQTSQVQSPVRVQTKQTQINDDNNRGLPKLPLEGKLEGTYHSEDLRVSTNDGTQDIPEEFEHTTIQIEYEQLHVKAQQHQQQHQQQHHKPPHQAQHHAQHQHHGQRQKRRHRRRYGLDDFKFLSVLGKGNFGKVMLAEYVSNNQLCAIKVLKKNFIVENDEVESTKSEKRVFLVANKYKHPFMLSLYQSFQTENRIYFVMEYISGGDLMWHVQQKRFSLKRAQFYASEILLALKFLHDHGIIYRDLKLDNIMLTESGHIKLADYGLCKENMWYGKTTRTFCGTPELMAPEIISGEQTYDKAVDWWAFGVLLYQMILTKTPFKGDDEEEVFNAILTDEPLYPINMSKESVDIIQKLLTRDPKLRLGSSERDALDIMEHPYFADVNFDDVLALKIKPPYIPQIDDPREAHCFEEEFTSQAAKLTPVNTVLSPKIQEMFRGFTYSIDDE